MSTYQCWHARVMRGAEDVEADSSFEARKIYAAKHHKQVSECMARKQTAEPRRVFSDGTSIRSEP